MKEPKSFQQGTKPKEVCPVCQQPLTVCQAIESVERDQAGNILSVRIKQGVSHTAKGGPEGRKLFQE